MVRAAVVMRGLVVCRRMLVVMRYLAEVDHRTHGAQRKQHEHQHQYENFQRPTHAGDAITRLESGDARPLMKTTLKPGLSLTKKIMVDESRCIGFMGKEGMVYATPRMLSDVEYACRDFLLEHLDAGEDSVGTHVSIDHLAATPLGLEVTIDAKIVEIDRRKIVFSFTVKDIEDVGRGKHVRFVGETAKSRERLAAKRKKAGLA